MVKKRYIAAVSLAIVAILAFAGLTLAQQVNAKITAPASGATVSGKVAITGTANGVNFGSYKVEFKSINDWVLTDKVYKTAVDNGTLATWDTTQVPDGNYDLRLLVMDVSGQYVTTQTSVKVNNAAAKAAAAAPRRGCLACHVAIAPDGRYTLGWEAVNAAKAAGITHPTLPNGFNTKVTECLGCHSASSKLPLSSIVHPAHMFSDTFKEHYGGNCFTCHEIKNGEFSVLTDKQTTNAKGVVAP